MHTIFHCSSSPFDHFVEAPRLQYQRHREAQVLAREANEKPLASTFPDRGLALKKLQRVNLPSLEFVCGEVRCNVPILPLPTEPRRVWHTKAELAEALLEWRF
jgi:hypothetical protein